MGIMKSINLLSSIFNPHLHWTHKWKVGKKQILPHSIIKPLNNKLDHLLILVETSKSPSRMIILVQSNLYYIFCVLLSLHQQHSQLISRTPGLLMSNVAMSKIYESMIMWIFNEGFADSKRKNNDIFKM